MRQFPWVYYHTAGIGGMTRQRFYACLERSRVDPDNQIFLVFDNWTPLHIETAHCPWGGIEINMLPPHPSFLNIVEQAISVLKAAIKAAISRLDIQATIDDRDKARQQGIPLAEYRQKIILEAYLKEIWIPSRLQNAQGGIHSCIHK